MSDWRGSSTPGSSTLIKPGNNVLMPCSNGCREWLDGVIGSGIKNLVVGGCTLNSCVRVSAIETRNCFRDEGLDVVVDLSLSGARSSNYMNSRYLAECHRQNLPYGKCPPPE